jgi:hypothetical protein
MPRCCCRVRDEKGGDRVWLAVVECTGLAVRLAGSKTAVSARLL